MNWWRGGTSTIQRQGVIERSIAHIDSDGRDSGLDGEVSRVMTDTRQ